MPREYSVTAPRDVIRPIRWAPGSMDHKFPSGPPTSLAMPASAQHADQTARMSAHFTRSKILNIGMYRQISMLPIMEPTTAIMIGSMSDVRASVVASTSWS